MGPTPYIKHADKFFAGAGAGLTAVTLTYPLDTIRARLAFQITGEHKYTGILHTASSILKEEGGVRALYRGFVPTLMGMVRTLIDGIFSTSSCNIPSICRSLTLAFPSTASRCLNMLA